MKFDLRNVQKSRNDEKRGLILPLEPSEELAEFVGIILGDGYLHANRCKYVIGIVGNPQTDLVYFQKIQEMIKILFNVEAKIKIGGRGLRIVFKSKGVCTFLTKILGFPYGKGKGQKVRLPQIFIRNARYSCSILRGLFDTDGTIFTSRKPGIVAYPCIELTTTSVMLATDVRNLLEKLKFRVPPVRGYNYPQGFLTSYKVSLYGKRNMEKWNVLIGFSK